MEDLLTQVLTISSSFPDIQKAGQGAIDFLAVQQGLIRDPAYELREKCLFLFQLCLETKRSKFISLAVGGFHKIIRDDRFHSSIEPEDDTKWLPMQLLQTVNCFLGLPDDTQVDILKIFLNIACSKKWTMNGRIIIAIICLCSEAFESGNAAVRAAAQASASQTLRSFCIVLEEEDEEGDKDASSFNELIPVMQFLCSKIDEAECSSHCEHGVVFLLECLLTLFSSLPQSIQLNKHFHTFLWQKLCPVLISVLGTPKVDKNIVTRTTGVEKERGRGSGGLGTAPSFSGFHAKTVYSINTELVRLVGSVASLRPVLESIFHRVLLYPAPEHRLDALRACLELVRNPNRLLDIAGPMFEEKEVSPICDMSLLQLIMDSIEESVKCSLPIMEASVMSCYGLLKAIEELCSGRCIPSSTAEILCNMYGKLPECNYTGPRTYQSIFRLPQLYRERIEKGTEETESNEYIEEVQERRYDSDSSGVTEGPEDEDGMYLPGEDIDPCYLRIPEIRNLDLHCDCAYNNGQESVRQFFAALQELLPQLTRLRSSIQVDQALQSFASQYIEEHLPDNCSWSADGVYVLTYYTLWLDMNLFQANYYSDSREHSCYITEDDFVMLVKEMKVPFLERFCLREIYQAVFSNTLLQTHGFLPTVNSAQPHALINLLTDIQGLGSYQQGSQMLWECRRLVKSIAQNDDNLEGDAGLRLSRLILTCCWKTILRVLAVPLSKKRFKSRSEKLRDLKFLKSEDHNRQVKQIITMCIEGLQITARLCNVLGLQDRCDSILELLVSASCSEPTAVKPILLLIQGSNSDVVRLTPSHALSLDLILGTGLELGSHCFKCWPHVFRCCMYVKKLERKYFSKSENRALGTTTKVTRKEENSTKDSDLTFDPQLEEDTCVDVYSFLCSTELPQTVAEIVSTPHAPDSPLKSSETAKVICVLSQLVDKLFEEAALKLNLKSLESFARALCFSCQEQLFPPAPREGETKPNWWQKLPVPPIQRQNPVPQKEQSDDTFLLDSLGEFMLKCVRSGRPLFHLMKMWSTVGPYLMEAACHKDLTVAKKTVKHIYDVVNAILGEHSELPHFHVNMSLFKPFHNLLELELCEPDIQDQIVSCICEFVETSSTEIRSGWRPLFGALRAVSSNVNLVQDVFRLFLDTENPLVFANAAVDYIICILKHLRLQSSTNHDPEVGLNIMKCIKRCEFLFSSIYKTPHTFVFHSADQIQSSRVVFLDIRIPELKFFDIDTIPQNLRFKSEVSYEPLITTLKSKIVTAESIDTPSRVLRLWSMLLWGRYSAIISANSSSQPTLLDMIYADLTALIEDPGPIFALDVLNTSILPMTQSWLQQLSKTPEGKHSGLRQSIGLLSDAVVHYFDRLHSEKSYEVSLNFLLNQTFLLLTECCVNPQLPIAKLGPSCMRHIIKSAGKTFTSAQWEVATLSLHRACDVTMIYLRQLMAPFSVDSQYYYGDSGQVKVAVRHGAPVLEVIGSLQLSHHVFLLDEQRNSDLSYDESLQERKMYTFLVNTDDDDNDVIRIPMQSLLMSLLSHESILQLVAEILLQGTKCYISSPVDVFNKNNSTPDPDSTTENLPGFMKCLKHENLRTLVLCLDYSYSCALAFDSRPGLKFLIQKVAGLEQAANLYSQARVAWAVKFVCLYEYCRDYVEDCELYEMSSLLMYEYEEDRPQWFLSELCITFISICSAYNKMMSESAEEEDKGTPMFFRNDERDLEERNGWGEKPFVLADFARKSEESSSESEPEDADLETHQAFHALRNFKRVKRSYARPKKTGVKYTKEPFVPPEIEQQRRWSFLKDGEALRRITKEMLTSVLELLRHLDDNKFRHMFPIFISGLRDLMGYASEPALKQVLTDLFSRVARIYGFKSP